MNNPFELFADWFEEAKQHQDIKEPTAMALATATKQAMPSVRIVLLKGFDEQGFVFYTNYESRKSQEISENPNVSICFFWQPLGKQVRIYGKGVKVSEAEADNYYNSRPLISRIGAWASEQSHPLENRAIMMHKVAELEKVYSEENPPPRPPYWSGWRIVPTEFEFWQEGEYRLHYRTLYTLQGDQWATHTLYP